MDIANELVRAHHPEFLLSSEGEEMLRRAAEEIRAYREFVNACNETGSGGSQEDPRRVEGPADARWDRAVAFAIPESCCFDDCPYEPTLSVEIKLPAWLGPYRILAESERLQRVAVCDTHEEFLRRIGELVLASAMLPEESR